MSLKKQQKGASRPLLIGSLLLLVVLVLAGISYGPDLLGYYRFSQALEAASQQAEAKGGPGPQLNEVCMPCHGADGNSMNQLYPGRQVSGSE